MPCLFPVHGYRSRERNPETGKRNIVYAIRKGLHDQPITVPCGQCIACRLEKSRQWALRCQKEAELYEKNCVVTLTYDDDNLPRNGSFDPEDAVLFMKRLRERVAPEVIRSYGCAEYGEKYGRPHFHICLFNYDFADKVDDPEMDQTEHRYYVSEFLAEVWDKGRTQIMDLTFDTAAYVARYCTKILKESRATPERIRKLIAERGEKLPERPVCVSRRPGIGKGWYDKWKNEIYANDKIYEDRGGRRIPMQPPSYFDRRFELDNPEKFTKIKQQRKSKGNKYTKQLLDYKNYQSTPKPMSEKICMEAKFTLLKRGYENEV